MMGNASASFRIEALSKYVNNGYDFLVFVVRFCSRPGGYMI